MLDLLKRETTIPPVSFEVILDVLNENYGKLNIDIDKQTVNELVFTIVRGKSKTEYHFMKFDTETKLTVERPSIFVYIAIGIISFINIPPFTIILWPLMFTLYTSIVRFLQCRQLRSIAALIQSAPAHSSPTLDYHSVTPTEPESTSTPNQQIDSSPIICKSCSAEVAPNSKFCTNCGTPVEA